MSNYKNVRGFTLIELMVTIAIMAIMAAFALPSMRNLVANTRIVNRSEQIANAIRLARVEAVRTNLPILICGVKIRKDGRSTGTCDNREISNGLLTFADKNYDSFYSPNDDMSIRTTTLNKTDTNSASRVKVDMKACPITTLKCNVPFDSNTIIFMPNGMTGYTDSVTASAGYAALRANSVLASHYIRVTVTDPNRVDSPKRYVVVSPGGAVVVCNPKNSTTGESSQGSINKICTDTTT